MILLMLRPAVALIVPAALVGCDSSAVSSAPSDAPKEDFCAAFAEGPPGVVTFDVTSDELQEWTDTLTEVGTPRQIFGDARLGFEVFVDYLAGLTDEEIEEIADGPNVGDPSSFFAFTGEDATRVRAFLGTVPALCSNPA